MSPKPQHCDDHCKLNETLTEVRIDVKWIKDKLSEKKNDLKWAFTFAIAVCGPALGLYALWVK